MEPNIAPLLKGPTCPVSESFNSVHTVDGREQQILKTAVKIERRRDIPEGTGDRAATGVELVLA